MTKLLNNIERTELPDYALNKKLPSDSYFTSTETAEKCYSILQSVVKNDNANIEDYTFIEPGAGNGSFYDLLNPSKRIGVDIVDRRDDIITADFLTWKPPDLSTKYITIGNPPFGVRGSIALAFINRAFLFSDYVGFILPMSFDSNGKGSTMKRVQNAHLIHSEILEQEKFHSPDIDTEININSLFQVWKRGPGQSIFKDYDVSEYADIRTVNDDPNRYCGMELVDEYDFFICSSCYGDTSIVFKFDDVKYRSGYGVLLKKSSNEIIEKLKKIDWNDYCSLATNSVKHIRRYHIEKALFDSGFGVESQGSPIDKFVK